MHDREQIHGERFEKGAAVGKPRHLRTALFKGARFGHSKFSVVGVVTATVERLAGGVVKALRRGSAPTKMRVARAIARHRQPEGASA